MSLKVQIIAITGASSGLGLPLSEQAASRGMHLALMARNEIKLHELANKIGGDILVFPGDVTSKTDCKEFINAIIEKFGSLDHLITNAGQSMWTNFDQIEDIDLFRKLMDVNFMGVVNCIHPAMDTLKKNSGQIVIISSIQSKFAWQTDLMATLPWGCADLPASFSRFFHDTKVADYVDCIWIAELSYFFFIEKYF